MAYLGAASTWSHAHDNVFALGYSDDSDGDLHGDQNGDDGYNDDDHNRQLPN